MGKSIVSKYMQEFHDKVELIRRNNGFSENDSIIASRGEAEDYGSTSMTPSAFRENYSIKDEKLLLDYLSDYQITDDENKKKIHKLIEGQHYIALSRLLDISFNFLVSLFFASEQENSFEKDGKVIVFCFPEFYSPSSEYIEKYYNKMLDNDLFVLQDNFKVITTKLQNDRIIKQCGGFIFFPGYESCGKIPECFHEEIIVKKRDKKKIIYELREYYNVFDSYIYPEKDKMKNQIMIQIAKGQLKNDYDLKNSNDFFNTELKIYLNQIKIQLNRNIKLISEESVIEEKQKKKINAIRFLRKKMQDLLVSIDTYKITRGNQYQEILEESKDYVKKVFLFYKECLDKEVNTDD